MLKFTLKVASVTCCLVIAALTNSRLAANGFSVQGNKGWCNRATLGKKSAMFSTTSSSSSNELLIEAMVEKPMGIVLEEIQENEARGVYCLECNEDSSAFVAGIRAGDSISSLAGTDVTSFTFDQVMELLGNSASPVAITVERSAAVSIVQEEEPEELQTRKKVKLQPKRMPSAKKLAKASTSVAFWKDPLMIGSAAFTVLLPLGIYLASSGSTPAS